MNDTKIQNFRNWLRANGAEILTTTNEYEVARWKANGATHVLYSSGKANAPDALVAWRCFVDGKKWRNTAQKKGGILKDGGMGLVGRQREKKSVLIRTLIARDGDGCFYCKLELGEDITFEHMLSKTHGGGWHVENLVLAHTRCNQSASHLSVMEKVRLRENGGTNK